MRHRITDDWVAGGQIGNLRAPPRWLDINLADCASRPAAVASAIGAIEDFGPPLFAVFENVPDLCERLVAEDVPGREAPLALEFLLCFSTVSSATAILERFLAARSDLLSQYRAEVDRFGSEGLPRILRTSYATQLAFATIAYGLEPPKGG